MISISLCTALILSSFTALLFLTFSLCYVLFLTFSSYDIRLYHFSPHNSIQFNSTWLYTQWSCAHSKTRSLGSARVRSFARSPVADCIQSSLLFSSIRRRHAFMSPLWLDSLLLSSPPFLLVDLHINSSPLENRVLVFEYIMQCSLRVHIPFIQYLFLILETAADTIGQQVSFKFSKSYANCRKLISKHISRFWVFAFEFLTQSYEYVQYIAFWITGVTRSRTYILKLVNAKLRLDSKVHWWIETILSKRTSILIIGALVFTLSVCNFVHTFNRFISLLHTLTYSVYSYHSFRSMKIPCFNT